MSDTEEWLMNELRDIVDRIEIEALREEFTDALLMHDFDRFAALFTDDGVWRTPDTDAVFTGRAAIRAGVQRLQGCCRYFAANVYPGLIQQSDGYASGRAYIHEFGQSRDGRFYSNFALYYDRYRREAGGWHFAERSYRIRYFDADSPPA